MKQKRIRQGLLALFFISAVLSFTRNSLGVAFHGEFNRFADLAEAMIMTRVAKSERTSPLLNGGLMLRDETLNENPDFNALHQAIYVEHQPIQEEWYYKSNPGIQGIFFSLIDRISPLSNKTNITLFRYLSAGISALILTLLLGWVLRTYSLFPGLFTSACLLMSTGLVVSGGHIYWISGLLFLPVLVCLKQMERISLDKTYPAWKMMATIALAFLVKGLVLGFEIATCTMIATTVPVFLIAYREKWTIRIFFRRFLQVSIAVFLGLFLTAGTLLIQLSQLQNKDLTGIGYLKERLEVRSSGGRYKGNAPDYLQESFDVSYGTVFKKYLRVEVFALPGLPPLTWLYTGRLAFPYWFWCLLAIGFSVVAWRSRDRALQSLVVATWVGVLALPSWLVLFKSHAYLHPHLNYLGWYLPHLFFVYILVSSTLEKLYLNWRSASSTSETTPP